jgi:hypothetical protein
MREFECKETLRTLVQYSVSVRIPESLHLIDLGRARDIMPVLTGRFHRLVVPPILKCR